jgi:hypothetical protein
MFSCSDKRSAEISKIQSLPSDYWEESTQELWTCLCTKEMLNRNPILSCGPLRALSGRLLIGSTELLIHVNNLQKNSIIFLCDDKFTIRPSLFSSSTTSSKHFQKWEPIYCSRCLSNLGFVESPTTTTTTTTTITTTRGENDVKIVNSV